VKSHFPKKVMVVYGNETLVCHPKSTKDNDDAEHVELLEEVTILKGRVNEEKYKSKEYETEIKLKNKVMLNAK